MFFLYYIIIFIIVLLLTCITKLNTVFTRYLFIQIFQSIRSFKSSSDYLKKISIIKILYKPLECKDRRNINLSIKHQRSASCTCILKIILDVQFYRIACMINNFLYLRRTFVFMPNNDKNNFQSLHISIKYKW